MEFKEEFEIKNEKIEEKLTDFPEFEDIAVSTKTFIIMTNISLNLQKLWEILPITEYVIIPKRRGRKKKINITDPNKDIPEGSIITVNLAGKVRGICLKKKKKGNHNYFRNSVTIVMIVNGKTINFKTSRNGKIQMTGCKFDDQAEKCIKYFWELIKDTEEVYEIPSGQPFRATFIPAMRNIDFSLGIKIDREKLNDFFNNNTKYYSLLEPSIGYTGVNIKIPITQAITSLKLKQIICKDGVWLKHREVTYDYYLRTLKQKEVQKKLEKEKYNTFLIFHSGKVIYSSMCAEFAREAYYDFIDIVKNNYESFREKLEED